MGLYSITVTGSGVDKVRPSNKANPMTTNNKLTLYHIFVRSTAPRNGPVRGFARLPHASSFSFLAARGAK